VAGPEALRHLQRHLDRRNLSLPFSHITFGADTNIQVAVLSRFPITRHYDHSDKGFSLYDRYQPVLRNFLEVEIQATTRYRFRLIAAHLKSKRPVFHANESEIRLEEARILRSLVVHRLKENPRLNLIVLGDLNDFPNSKTLKLIKGSGKLALVDARPAEIQLRTGAAPAMPSRRPSIAWTHYFEAQDTYSRLDYLLLSPGMKSEWVPEESFVYSGPRWGDASDHRPLLVTFEPLDQEASNRR
jgi:endonuclease/exonuclease/phosphatase family metal-dependent hydrolase